VFSRWYTDAWPRSVQRITKYAILSGRGMRYYKKDSDQRAQSHSSGPHCVIDRSKVQRARPNRWTCSPETGFHYVKTCTFPLDSTIYGDKDRRATLLRVRQTIVCNWTVCAVFSKQEVADSAFRAVKIHIDHEHLFYLSIH